MKEFAIISGKGGTGKTSITAAFAFLAEKAVVCDTDVDAADLHLLLRPQPVTRNDFFGGYVAEIDLQKCHECGLCMELCRFAAIGSDFCIDPVSCEGCGVCADLCPEQAIAFIPKKSGEWFVSKSKVGHMVHARLGIAEENSGKLVSVIRKEAKKIATKYKSSLIITDGPPGIGCPVIAAIGGATAAVIIVEPTISGLHDIKRVIGLISHFKLPGMVCVNKYDINLKFTEKIEEFSRDNGLKVLPRIPFEPLFTHAMVMGQSIMEYAASSPTAKIVEKVWMEIVANKYGTQNFSRLA